MCSRFFEIVDRQRGDRAERLIVVRQPMHSLERTRKQDKNRKRVYFYLCKQDPVACQDRRYQRQIYSKDLPT